MSKNKGIHSDIERPMSLPGITFKDAKVESDHNKVSDIDTEPLHKDTFAAIAFMNEPITVMVQETTDKNAEAVVPVGNNGKFVFFKRGVPVTCARKFVDSLIVKTSTIATPEIINNGGERAFSIQQQSALKYPFMVIEDKNPLGVAWLRKRLAEPV